MRFLPAAIVAVLAATVATAQHVSQRDNDRALIDGTLLGKAATAEMWQGDPKAGYAALGQWSYPVTPKGCTTPQHVVERRGAVGNVQVRNLIAPERGIAIVAFAASTVPDFGEPWQGKGLTWELLSAALCPVAP